MIPICPIPVSRIYWNRNPCSGCLWVVSSLLCYHKKRLSLEPALSCWHYFDGEIKAHLYIICPPPCTEKLFFVLHPFRKRWCRKNHNLLLPQCATGVDAQKGACVCVCVCIKVCLFHFCVGVRMRTVHDVKKWNIGTNIQMLTNVFLCRTKQNLLTGPFGEHRPGPQFIGCLLPKDWSRTNANQRFRQLVRHGD